MHRFAQCMVIWNIFQNSVIHISRNHNYAIAKLIQIIDTGFLNNLNYRMQLFCMLFIWNIMNFIEIIWHINCKTNLWNYFPFTHICIIVCVDLVTPASVWRHKALPRTWLAKSCIDFFIQCTIRRTNFGNSLANFGFVMYQNELTYVIIGFNHDVPALWDRKECIFTNFKVKLFQGIFSVQRMR